MVEKIEKKNEENNSIKKDIKKVPNESKKTLTVLNKNKYKTQIKSIMPSYKSMINQINRPTEINNISSMVGKTAISI